MVNDHPKENIKEEGSTSEKPKQSSKPEEPKYVLNSLRPYCSKLFGIANHTFIAVLHFNRLTLNDTMTKTEFERYVKRYKEHPVTT